MKERLAAARLTWPALTGIAAALLITPLLPLLKPLFGVPGNGIGLVSVTHYPKSWDYAVVGIYFAVAAVATLVAALVWPRASARGLPAEAGTDTKKNAWIIALLMLVVTLAILPARDHPYAFADPYHEGENLSPASVMKSGGHPYRDVWFMHGLFADGGLDRLVQGDPPSILPTRRARAILNAVAVALLVPIAAEVSATWLGVIFATIASLCALAAGQLPATPHFRLLPLLLAVWFALIANRTGKSAWAIGACLTASAAMLWSLDIGLFATAGLWAWLILARPFKWKSIIACAAATLLTAPLLLFCLRGDVSRFFRDSFLRLPECFDAIYSLPAPPLPELKLSWIDSPSARYYLPPIAYGVLAALSLLVFLRGDRKRASAMLLVAFTAFMELRTASGRASWGHTRFAVPLLGIVLVAFAIEPLIRSRHAARIAVAIAMIVGAVPYLEIVANARYLGGYYATYRERLRPTPGTVPFPFPRARDLYTYPQEATDLGALHAFSLSQPEGPIFDYSGEKWLYYMLGRPAATRCHDLSYLSDPALGREAMKQLERRRPVFVVISGLPTLAQIDGVSNVQRTPWLAEWIDRNYARRITIGRYTIGLPSGHELQQNVPR